MGHFLDVAIRALSESKRPLSPNEIIEIALARNWLKTKGKTPWQTMKSKLSTDILEKKERSVFMRTAKNKFALRAWGQDDEFVADRFQKALLDEEVVVFPAKSLKKYIPEPGFHNLVLKSGRELLGELSQMPRYEAEKDFSMIQLVSVFIIKHNKNILTYKRAKRLPEDRLHGKYSAMFGGHLNPKDTPPLFNIFDPKEGIAFLLRELEEEIAFPEGERPIFQYKGLLYDDSRPLSSQHLGIVYDVFTRSLEYKIRERGFLMDPKWETIAQIDNRLDDFENWSVLLIKHEKQVMTNKLKGD
jgi:predicted NUDIX family phosphoesterase